MSLLKQKQRIIKGFGEDEFPYWHNDLFISRLQGLFPGRHLSQNFKVGNQVHLMFDIGLSPGKKWRETRKAFNKGKVVISSGLIPAKNTVD